MKPAPLRLGPLTVPGYSVWHSGVNWLRGDGHLCRPGETVAFFNISLVPNGEPRDSELAFSYDERELQTGLATTAGGILRRSSTLSHGGGFDRHDAFRWAPDSQIGSIEPVPGQTPSEADGELRLLMTAGQSTDEFFKDRSGVTSRGWRVEDDRPVGTVLSLGICELDGVIRGEGFAFAEMLAAATGPAQIVFVPDKAVIPGARLLAEQLRRTDSEREAMARDFADSIARGPLTPAPEDWILAGTILSALGKSPMTGRYPVMGRHGLRQAGRPDAIVLSLMSETRTIFRHRRLGYGFHCHDYRLKKAGPAFTGWLRTNFELVPRGIDDIRDDYRALFKLIRAAAPRTQILIHNLMSTSGYEDIQSYALYDAPLGSSLARVHNKDMNLMLQDLAREEDIAIIDADAIAAELGGRRCLLWDNVHQSGLMQGEVRAEVLRILRARGVPGFG